MVHVHVYIVGIGIFELHWVISHVCYSSMPLIAIVCIVVIGIIVHIDNEAEKTKHVFCVCVLALSNEGVSIAVLAMAT